MSKLSDEIGKIPEVIALQNLVDEVGGGNGVHFSFGPNAHEATYGDLANDAAEMLRKYQNGEMTTLKYGDDGLLIGDPFGHNESKEDSE
jgi:hypothetical protein